MTLDRELVPDPTEAAPMVAPGVLDSLPGDEPAPSGSTRADELRAVALRAQILAADVRVYLRPLPQLPAA